MRRGTAVFLGLVITTGALFAPVVWHRAGGASAPIAAKAALRAPAARDAAGSVAQVPSAGILATVQTPAPVSVRVMNETPRTESLAAWAARDLPAAYRWAAQLEDPAARAEALARVFEQASGEAPQATLELAQGAPLGALRETVLQRLAVKWAAEDPAAATAWAMAQPASESRDGVFQQLALARVVDDPAGAAHLIRFGISPGAVQEDAAAQALAHWPAAEFARAVAWVGELPAGALRRRAEAELAARMR